jgi:hypothetical protein
MLVDVPLKPPNPNALMPARVPLSYQNRQFERFAEADPSASWLSSPQP